MSSFVHFALNFTIILDCIVVCKHFICRQCYDLIVTVRLLVFVFDDACLSQACIDAEWQGTQLPCRRAEHTAIPWAISTLVGHVGLLFKYIIAFLCNVVFAVGPHLPGFQCAGLKICSVSSQAGIYCYGNGKDAAVGSLRYADTAIQQLEGRRQQATRQWRRHTPAKTGWRKAGGNLLWVVNLFLFIHYGLLVMWRK